MSETHPYCRFGIVADVQYADRHEKKWYTNRERTEFDPKKTRNYRKSFEKFKEYARISQSRRTLDAFIQLGDLIDSSSRFTNDVFIPNSAEKVLDTLNQALDVVYSFKAKNIINCIGNHDVRSLEKTNAVWESYDLEYITGYKSCFELIKNKYFGDQNLKADCFCYEKSINDKISIVNIDTFDLSVYGREPGSKQFEEAMDILEKNNPNHEKFSTRGMDKPFEKRFVQWTGGVSEKQLKWLDETLERLDKENKHVIIVTHCPILPESISVNKDRWLEVCLTWNYDQVLEVLNKHKCVQVCLTGHNHVGGRAVSETGINFLGIKGLIENADEGCFGVLQFFDDYMLLKGVGACKSQKMNYR